MRVGTRKSVVLAQPSHLFACDLRERGSRFRIRRHQAFALSLASACIRRHQTFALSPVRDASACIRRHQAFALSPVRERRIRVCKEAPGFRPGPRVSDSNSRYSKLDNFQGVRVSK